jgi:hypothetical protein
MALINSISTTLTFKPLHDNDNLEIATTLLTSTKVTISTTELEMADSLLFQERTRQCELHPPNKQKAKCQRLQVITQPNYQKLSYKLREQVVTSTHESQMLVTIDQTLKVFRAQLHADTAVDVDATTTGAYPRRTHTKIPANQGGEHNGKRVNRQQAVGQTIGNVSNLHLVP